MKNEKTNDKNCDESMHTWVCCVNVDLLTLYQLKLFMSDFQIGIDLFLKNMKSYLIGCKYCTP